MPGQLFIPPQVLRAIQKHVEKAVRHAESGYHSAQEEEDTITGELGGALRTKRVRTVSVTDGQVRGTWRWSITYSKFRSKAGKATESIVGADGILEIRVGNPEQDQRKTALFQAKNTLKRDPKLVEQCAKMSIWREAAFVIGYAAEGFKAYSIDDILRSGGSLARVNDGIPLGPWIVDTFIGCRVGHPDLYYDRDERKLYWMRVHLSGDEYSYGKWVWVDFRPKHLISIDVTPPHWARARAEEITPNKISVNRLTFTPEDLFEIESPFTLPQLKKRRAELLTAYHSDKNHNLSKYLKSLLDGRVIEINQTFSRLSKKAEVGVKPQDTEKANKTKSPSGLEEPRTPTIDEVLTKGKVNKEVKIPRRKKHD